MKTPTLEDIAAAAVKLYECRRDGYGKTGGTGHSKMWALRELNTLIARLPHDVRKSLWRRDGRSVHRV